MNIYDQNRIIALSTKPKNSKQLIEWFRQEAILDYIDNEIEDDNVIIYASLPDVYIHSVFIPKTEINEEVKDDLLGWSSNPDSQWSYVYSGDNIWIETPLSNSGSELLQQGEQIIHYRSFTGVSSREKYFELNQKLAHVLELHYMREFNSWCKLDNFGDIWEVIKVLVLDELNGFFSNTIIYGNKKLLGEYATINDYLLLRMFDITRISEEFFGWRGERTSSDLSITRKLYGEITIVEGDGSFSRGFQVADISVPKQEIIDRFWNKDRKEEKKYEKFIALDWRHRKIDEISCDSSCLASYFDKTDLPFETTPAFFKPEVLLKYKDDRDKYTLNENSISCRGSWFIQSYDVNDVGQVSVYLSDLGNLPHNEQLHWKQYNEKPKASISEKAFKRDFKGEWYDLYEPLQSIKQKLYKLQETEVDWWQLRSEGLSEKVQYPYSASKDEWADEILNLHQLIVEGFSERVLRSKAKDIGRKPEAKLGSLKLMEECLVGFGFEKDRAYEIMTPFHKLHNLRIKLKAHSSGKEAMDLTRKAIEEHGSFHAHFVNLCKECDESLEVIISAINEDL